MVPNGALWGPLGTLGRGRGTPLEQQEPDISFLLDLRSLVASILESKWRPKVIKAVLETELKNNMEFNHLFDEKVTHLGCQNVCFMR